MSIEDVTARVNGAVKAGMTDAEAFAARRAEIAAIEAESLKATGLRSDVVTLYQGGQYNLYRYKKYTDVRLVFVPEFQAAFFGGDPDNFNFPRFNIDMALVRVYENDQPVKSGELLQVVHAGRERRQSGFRDRPSGFDFAPEYRRASGTTARHQHSDHHSLAGTSRSDAQEIHGDGRRANAPGAERTEQHSEQFEGLSRTTCRT